ncbi:DCD domain-containing protein NRP-B-like [Lolium rigidum]|uniref:DCD domain-containing protein NRP-B-like n=1 Tax=Lolium rigidum TaxID=89674 RepID=UPI001F5D59E0|nr:DCD domain-containing protein NRP-B-like [Lolium rigidum]
MEGYDREFWQFSDQLRLQTAGFSGLSLGDSIWSPADNARARNADSTLGLFSPDAPAKINANDGPGLIGSGKLAFGATKADRYNNTTNNLPAGDAKAYGYGAPAKPNSANLNNNNASFALNKMMIGGSYNNNSNNLNGGSGEVKSYFNKSIGRPASNNNGSNYGGGGYGKNKGALDGGKKKHAKNNDNNNNNHGAASEKRFKTLPASEALPRNEPIGGYIFVCNNDTMEENLKRQLFGLPSRYRDSVRAIRPGLPLFLYNYSTHQLHGIFEAASFGGANIDPAAWEDKKCHGESRFPAQVRVATRKICDPLEEDAFRPILHHYDGPKFRLELSITEALSLLDIFEDKDDA